MSIEKIPPVILFESMKDVWVAWKNKLNSYSMRTGLSRTEKSIEKIKDRIDRTASREKLTILKRMLSISRQIKSLYEQGLKITEKDDFDKESKTLLNIARKIDTLEEDMYKLKRRVYIYKG